MRNAFIAGFFVACAATAVAAQTAQTSPSPTPTQTPAASTNGTMTLLGCIGGGATASDPYMLSDVSLGTVGSATATQSTARAGVAGGTSTGVPIGTTGTRPGVTPTTPATPPATAGSAGTAGSTGVGVSTGAGTGTVTGSGVGTMATGSATGSGTGTMATGAPARPGAATAATPAPGAGTMNPSGMTTALSSGYRLSGYDVSGLKGQRVQIVGSLAPTTTAPGTPAAGAREFRVQSVKAVPGGGCPQR